MSLDHAPPRGQSTAVAVVGYKSPPVEHRFKKGVSGNPNGRPRKRARDNPANGASTQLDDILLAEAMRPIQLRENDRIIELPMIQAVVRAMGVAAVKGSHRAQQSLASMVQAVQSKRFEDLKALYASAIEYKQHWLDVFEEHDHRGLPRPDPVPHPDEVVIESRDFKVRFNGPVTLDEKAEWDQMLKRREDALHEIAEYKRLLRRKPKHSSFLEEEIVREQRLADMIGGIIPDEKTRRRPSFDLQEWRDKSGVVAELRKKQRNRNRRQP